MANVTCTTVGGRAAHRVHGRVRHRRSGPARRRDPRAIRARDARPASRRFPTAATTTASRSRATTRRSRSPARVDRRRRARARSTSPARTRRIDSAINVPLCYTRAMAGLRHQVPDHAEDPQQRGRVRADHGVGARGLHPQRAAALRRPAAGTSSATSSCRWSSARSPRRARRVQADSGMLNLINVQGRHRERPRRLQHLLRVRRLRRARGPRRRGHARRPRRT